MCGLIAAWDPSGLEASRLAAALADMHHRGPDAQGECWRAGRNLYFGHARLKIIDTSDGANQPFVSPCGRWVLVFNGEIYNYPALRAEIGDSWQWRTHSDTEVLMAAWSLWGTASLDRLVGMFAFALHDAELQTLVLVRDRFGIKPLYQIAVDGRRVFSSEIPPLLRFLPKVEVDQSVIRTYLEQGMYDHCSRTFFAGVEALEPGYVLEIDLRNAREQKRCWYRLADHIADLSGIAEAELLERSDALIQQAIHSHLIADVVVGLNVSGGVDSSMLVRTTIEKLGRAHLFTQDYEGYSELPWVRDVSEGGELHVASLDRLRIEDYLNDTVRSQAEPFGGVFVCGYNALYELACRENVTVLLDGNGVDEIFLGYKRYHQIHVAAAPEQERQARVDAYRQFWGEMPRNSRVGASIDGTDGIRPDVLAPDLLRHSLLEAKFDGDFADPVRKAAAQDLLCAKIPRGLRFNDRVSMAHSRELRVPFLDHRLVEFAFGLSSSLLLNARGSKAIFRDLLARRVGPSVAYAVKRSVQSPQREWLAESWRPLVESILESGSFAERGWVVPAKAKEAYVDYCNGARENSFFIWQWLNLELWAREYLDRRPELLK